MRVTKEKSAEHRQAIVVAASRLFRERGFDDVGVIEITRLAGLTHGAFYGHFPSKDALCAIACRHAFDERIGDWGEQVSLAVYLDRYISPAHRDNPGEGCPIVSLSPHIGRQKLAVRKEFSRGVSRFVDLIAEHLPPKFAKAHAKKRAAAILSTMVGGMVLARSTAFDPNLSLRMLSESRATIASRFEV